VPFKRNSRKSSQKPRKKARIRVMDSEQDISAEAAQDTAYAGAGARLRKAREAKRLELSHIAAETRIPLRHLEVIEEGDFSALPSRTYAIGFSRTYARILGLDDAAIVEAVRGELADGSTRRSSVGSGMEPGDPAKLPSATLAWFGAFAALVLAVGLIAFFSSRFGAGTGPAPIEAPSPTPTPAAAAAAAPADSAPAAENAEVVLTALGDGVWVRIYEEGGERLLEKQLARDESFTVPADAVDPRINTGRPDLLAITVGGKSVPPLAERPTTLAGMAISAEALLARPAPEPAATSTTTSSAAAPATTASIAPRPAARRTAPAGLVPAAATEAAPAGAVRETAASQPATGVETAVR